MLFRSVALGDQGDALDGVDQGAGGNRGGDGGGLGEQPPHRRVLAVDQGRGGTPTAGLESDQVAVGVIGQGDVDADRKSTRLNSSHVASSYAVFCLKKKTAARQWRHCALRLGC